MSGVIVPAFIGGTAQKVSQSSAVLLLVAGYPGCAGGAAAPPAPARRIADRR
jgi:hypothetical protein